MNEHCELKRSDVIFKCYWDPTEAIKISKKVIKLYPEKIGITHTIACKRNLNGIAKWGEFYHWRKSEALRNLNTECENWRIIQSEEKKTNFKRFKWNIFYLKEICMPF